MWVHNVCMHANLPSPVGGGEEGVVAVDRRHTHYIHGLIGFKMKLLAR